MNKQNFNDEYDHTNDDGYSMLDDMDVPQEWLDEEEEYWSGQELDPSDEDNYDLVERSDNDEDSDEWDDDGWDDEDRDADMGIDYDGYNDPDNY